MLRERSVLEMPTRGLLDRVEKALRSECALEKSLNKPNASTR